MNQSAYAIQFMKGSVHNTLELSGNLTISHIESVYKDLKGSIDFSKKTILNINQVKGIDLTCVQVLISLKKEFEDNRLPLEINLQLTDDQQHLLDNAGFSSNFFK